MDIARNDHNALKESYYANGKWDHQLLISHSLQQHRISASSAEASYQAAENSLKYKAEDLVSLYFNFHVLQYKHLVFQFLERF